MKKNPFFVNVLLVIFTGLVCLAEFLIRMLSPATLLPRFGLPMLAANALLALMLEAYLGSPEKRYWVPMILLGGVTLTALPLCAGIALPQPIWAAFLAGCAVFGVLCLIFTGCRERMTGRLAPLACGVILFLACQCLHGMY